MGKKSVKKTGADGKTRKHGKKKKATTSPIEDALACPRYLYKIGTSLHWCRRDHLHKVRPQAVAGPNGHPRVRPSSGEAAAICGEADASVTAQVVGDPSPLATRVRDSP